MRIINYEKKAKVLIKNDVYNMLSILHEYKGEHRAYEDNFSEILKSFELSAKIQSIEAMNNIFGSFIAVKTIEELLSSRKNPLSKKEVFACGYRDILGVATNNYDKFRINTEFIDRLCFELLEYEQFFDKDNRSKGYCILNSLIADNNLPDKRLYELFEMCLEFNREMAIGEFDSLILITVYIFDFIKNNFYDRATVPLGISIFIILLCKSGYTIGKYISLESILGENLDEFTGILNGDFERDNYEDKPYYEFLCFVFKVLNIAYQRFFVLIKLSGNKNLSKPEKVLTVIKNSVVEITKKDILNLCPDISNSTVEHTLNSLLEEGIIKKVKGGRSTAYIYK